MIKDVLKRQTVIIAVAVIGVCLCLMGVSYAVFFDIDKSNPQTVTSGSLTVQFSNGTEITTANKPQSDTEGKENSYQFSVTNQGTLPMDYSIYLYNDPDAAKEKDVTMIPHEYLNVQLDDGEVKTLDQFPELAADGKQMRKLNTETLNVPAKADGSADNVKQHIIRIWIDENAPEDIIGNTIALQLVVLGESDESSWGGGNA